MDTTTPTGPGPDQDPEACQLRTIRLLRTTARHAYQQGRADALLGRRARPARPTGPAGRTDHPGPRPRTTGPGRRPTPPQQQEEHDTRPLTVLDPADGTVLATLDPGGARAVPAEGVTVGPVADVNGITVQALTRGWGSPTTYYVVASHTPTTPLTRAEAARLAQVLIDAVTREVA
ncbi:hypothetical protein D5R93_02210 [Actinomyces lilanjuaniae]|uniref:Uncharacterized protein n=1 Tax=Actinomyces lilanjuaniae TaxID=2321394 RepID=A0ABN5PLS5_9ACTO|nr:hypothetical protein [Actinomyces lilanjuaniae]AYD89161.1 hypothetical protein D5R93_02210 [Actinomyces lilanjuaniae]